MEPNVQELLEKITTGIWSSNGVPQSELTSEELKISRRFISWGWARWDKDGKHILLLKATNKAFDVSTSDT